MIFLGRVRIQIENHGFETPCLIWAGAVNSKGYGTRGNGAGKIVLVHRWVWEQSHGAIPDGVHIHHLCGQRRCINRTHLEAVTPRQHVRTHHNGTISELVLSLVEDGSVWAFADLQHELWCEGHNREALGAALWRMVEGNEIERVGRGRYRAAKVIAA